MYMSTIDQGVQTLMNSEPLCLDVADSVSRCVEEMEQIEWQPALVTKDDVVVGIVTWRHFISLLASGMSLSEVQRLSVRDIMEVNPTTIPHDATQKEAVSAYNRCESDFIIVTHFGSPIGLITEDTLSHRAYPLFDQRIGMAPVQRPEVA